MENSTIGALRAEHRNFEHVLSLVRFQVLTTARHDKESCQFLMNAIGYLQQFEGGAHLEKEEMIFARILRQDPSLAGVCNRLREQRKLLHEQELAMLRHVWRAQAGDREACTRLKELAAAYCDTQLAYITLEEANVFPAALNYLQEQDWKEIAARSTKSIDPVFGPEARKQHQSPYDGLLTMSSSRPN